MREFHWARINEVSLKSLLLRSSGNFHFRKEKMIHFRLHTHECECVCVMCLCWRMMRKKEREREASTFLCIVCDFYLATHFHFMTRIEWISICFKSCKLFCYRSSNEFNLIVKATSVMVLPAEMSEIEMFNGDSNWKISIWSNRVWI